MNACQMCDDGEFPPHRYPLDDGGELWLCAGCIPLLDEAEETGTPIAVDVLRRARSVLHERLLNNNCHSWLDPYLRFQDIYVAALGVS